MGYHNFHKRQVYNFQLNRWHSLGYTSFEDCVEAGANVRTFADWKREMIRLGDNSASDGLLLRAAFYYRAAEFYLLADVPEKEFLYDKFSALFHEAVKSEDVVRHKVPYKETYLPAMKLSSKGQKKGAIVMHGGFDSFIEEFYSMMRYFSNCGYDVIGFEGPGQGAARRKCGLSFDYQWEKPVSAVLDYFGLEDVTLFGISMGGWFCLRAAAFDSRIKRVVATGHAFDYLQMAPRPLQRFVKFILQFETFSNWSSNLKMKYMPRSSREYWEITHSMYITKTNTALAALKQMLQLNEENLHSEMIRQDVLVLAGGKDHYIPLKMLNMQVKALVNAKSVTSRIFTKEEHAENHCQIGNIGLLLEVMTEWINNIDSSSPKPDVSRRGQSRSIGGSACS